eukprot:TRINITY_DN9025_c0_g1_i3.p1 TRINITY_DN9025_c0_g1~~TRINITY_DN9025_c0_g1_i3.p1  ORF type:complete len:949 (-),score=280.62 TRINITY_DN9025_c0_g1_i3:46-2892(-)
MCIRDRLETEIMPVVVMCENVLPLATEGVVDDLAGMVFVHHPAILDALRQNSFSEIFYVNAGPHLISIRDNDRSHRMLKSSDSISRALSKRPHLMKVATDTYTAHHSAGQSVLFYGQSGSGKTQAFHTCLQYLFAVAGCPFDPLILKIKRCLQLVQSLSCAVTQTGVNSSLGAVALELSLGSSECYGAKVRLEGLTSVHCVRPHLDCNLFHIMHQLISGLSTARLQGCLLHEVAYTIASLHKHEGLTDAGAWSDTLATLSEELGWEAAKINEFEQLLIVITHLGQLDIGNREGASVTELLYSRSVTAIAELLDVAALDLLKALLGASVVIQHGDDEERAIGPQVAAAAQGSVIALACGMYSRLVAHVVDCVNQSLATAASKPTLSPPFPIVLFDTPGLLQMSGEGTMADLAHNYGCEIVTQQFAAYEKRRLGAEHTGQDPESLATKQDDLIRWGLLPLDDSPPLNLFKSSLEEVFSEFKHLPPAQHMRTLYAENYSHPSFRRNLDYTGTCFSIKHTAGEVVYDLEPLGMLSHAQELLPSHVKLLKLNSSELVQMLCTAESLSEDSVLQSVSRDFDNLFNDVLSSTEQHHVFSMKPFAEAAPANSHAFDPVAIMEQMNGTKLTDSIGAQVALKARVTLQKIRELNQPGATNIPEQAAFLARAVVAALGVIPSQKAMGVSQALLFGEQIKLIGILAEIQMHAAARRLQSVFRGSAGYEQWETRRSEEQDPALVEAARVEDERQKAVAARSALRAAQIDAQRELQERDRSAFLIQQWWRYNRNRRHLEQRGLRAVVERKALESDLEMRASMQEQREQQPSRPSGAEVQAARLEKVEAAYQKALQMRGAVQDPRSPLPSRTEARLAEKLRPATVVDHSSIEELARSSPLKATRMASQFPAGKYNRKYQRKYALGQDGRYLEHGYNSEDSSASSITDSDECSSDEGIDSMTVR